MKKLAIVLLVVAVTTGIAQEKKSAKKKAPAKKVEMTTTASGLKYHDDVVGTGPEVKDGDQIEVHYTGTFMDGKVFDSSVPRKKPFPVNVGKGGVIKCWDEGVKGMKVGGKRKLVCPPELAYGAQGYPGAIPPNSTLNFDIELLKIK
jgi:FKBP-type peptidyl-prolyl cis-trans isomerase